MFPCHSPTYKLLGDIRLFANLQRRDKYNKVPPGVRGIRSLAFAADQQMLLCAGYEVEAFGWDIRTQSMVSKGAPRRSTFERTLSHGDVCVVMHV